LSGGKQTAITQKGVGMWWKASFETSQLVHRVRVKNRVDCCGERLRDTTVTIDGKICGNLPGSTKTGVWYEVKCEKPLMGKEI
jgi:hypothetical protein